MKVSEVAPFSGTLAAPKAALITGGAAAVSVAFAVLPVPPLVEVTCTLLFFTPPVAAVTFAENVQEPLAASVAPARVTAKAPGVAVIVPPPHVPARPLGVETTRPAGKLSVKATPVSGEEFATGFVSTKVSEVVPPAATLATANDFAIVGGLATDRLAEAVLPAPPLVALTAPVVLV